MYNNIRYAPYNRGIRKPIKGTMTADDAKLVAKKAHKMRSFVVVFI